MRRHEEEGRPVHAHVRPDAALVLQDVAHAAHNLRQLDHLPMGDGQIVVLVVFIDSNSNSSVWRIKSAAPGPWGRPGHETKRDRNERVLYSSKILHVSSLLPVLFCLTSASRALYP